MCNYNLVLCRIFFLLHFFLFSLPTSSVFLLFVTFNAIALKLLLSSQLRFSDTVICIIDNDSNKNISVVAKQLFFTLLICKKKNLSFSFIIFGAMHHRNSINAFDWDFVVQFLSFATLFLFYAFRQFRYSPIRTDYMCQNNEQLNHCSSSL